VTVFDPQFGAGEGRPTLKDRLEVRGDGFQTEFNDLFLAQRQAVHG
jgi:hypothetical protein